MKKRGQVSVFVVIGVVVIILAALIFFFRGKIVQTIREEPLNPQEYLAQQLEDIKQEVGSCVSIATRESSKLLMENGGSFDREFNFIRYYNISYPILCKAFEDDLGCLAEPILISNLVDKLNSKLPEEINDCLNLEEFRGKDYDLTTGGLNLTNEIFEDYVLVNLDFLVKLQKESYSAQSNEFVYRIDVPIGALTNVVNKLVQDKARGLPIDPIGFGLTNFNKFRVKVDKPYPDEVYDVSLTSSDEYHFYFAIEGSGRFERPEGRIR